MMLAMILASEGHDEGERLLNRPVANDGIKPVDVHELAVGGDAGVRDIHLAAWHPARERGAKEHATLAQGAWLRVRQVELEAQVNVARRRGGERELRPIRHRN